MKKQILSVAAAVMALSAQALTFGPVTAVSGTPSGASHPVLSPDGNTLLFAAPVTEALSLLDLASGEISVLDDAAGAAATAVFAADSRSIAYKTFDRIDGLACSDVRIVRLDGKKHVRSVGRMQRKPQIAQPAGDCAVADYSTIKVSRGGTVTDITPVEGAFSYQNAQLSPDGSRIVFTVPFQGVFVCNADGSGAERVAERGSRPVWAGNSVIAFILSHDDGYVILSSQLVTCDLDSRQIQVVSDPDTIVEDATGRDGLIVFSTLAGDIKQVTFTR